MSAFPRTGPGTARRGRAGRRLRLSLIAAVAATGFGFNAIPAHASTVPYGTVLISGAQWAGSDASRGDLNVYSNGLRNQDTMGTYGLQYECTELVQRWAHLMFGEPDNWPVTSAADMWNVGPALPHPLSQNPNGGASAPRFGDIMVFGATAGDPTGHVAVVSGVSSNSVTIVQQNFTVNGTLTGGWTQPLSGTTVPALGGLPVLGWLRAGVVVPPPPPPPTPLTSLSAPSAAVTPDGSAQTLFWTGRDGHLTESWYSAGAWHGPIDYSGFGILQSPPAVAITANGQSQVVFWQGSNNHLYEAWYTTSWNGPVDLTATWHGVAPATSPPTVTTMSDGTQLLFWRGPDNRLWEAWFAGGQWHGPVTFGNSNTLASAPSASVLSDGSQMVFWRATDGHLWESWFTDGRWNGPAELGFGWVASAPSLSVTPNSSVQLLFWRGANSHLYEAWYNAGWNGPVDVTAAQAAGGSPLASSPTSAVTPNNTAQVVFFQGGGGVVFEAWFANGRWNGPVPMWGS